MNPLLLGLIGKVVEVVGNIVDPTKKAEAQLEIMKLQQASEFKDIDAQLALAQGQTDINKVEAASPNLFVSGWRPFIGWVCGSGLAFQFLLAPLITWGTNLAGHSVPVPSLDLSTLLTLLLGMLGLGSMRTYEKTKGVAS